MLLNVSCRVHSTVNLLVPWDNRYFERQWAEGSTTPSFEAIRVTLGFLEGKLPQQMRQKKKDLHLCQPFAYTVSSPCEMQRIF